MNRIQVDIYYNLKELQGLMNNFEKVFPILQKNIKKYNIDDNMGKFYLAWNAGIYFYKKDSSPGENFILDVLFKNIYKSFQIDKLSTKSLLFIFFCFGAVSSLNYPIYGKDFFRHYMGIVSKGAVIIDTLKFDVYKNGYKHWQLSTLIKFFLKKSVSASSKKNFLKEDEKQTKNINKFLIN